MTDTVDSRARRYASLGEIAKDLGRSSSTVRDWVRSGLFPAPDAIFGGMAANNHSMWDGDRVRSLIVEGADTGESDYQWDVTPEHYVTRSGIASLLHLSPNTIKFWIRDPSSRASQRQRVRWSIPCDATTVWGAGWKIENVWNWWNNEYAEKVGDYDRQYRSVIYTQLVDTGKVALVDYQPPTPLQIRKSDPADRIEYISAATLLERPTNSALSSAAPGCWFVPDISELDTDRQKQVLAILADCPRAAVVLYTDPSNLPAANDLTSDVTVVDQDALRTIIG